MIDTKRSKGQYFTKGNPFCLRPFQNWLGKTNLSHENLLEPFAGANDIVNTLRSMRMCSKFSSYDISPSDKLVKKKDTIKKFPTEYKVCITNPPGWQGTQPPAEACLIQKQNMMIYTNTVCLYV